MRKLPTPCYIIEEEGLLHNLEILKKVQQNTGAKILLAQKAFSYYPAYPLLGKYLAGTAASGLYEARLGKEEMAGREVHVYAPAYREEEWEELLSYADHIVFNSPAQLEKFGRRAKEAGKEVGLRINPMCSTQKGPAIYDPCSPGSRLGTTKNLWEEQMTAKEVSLLDGLHFHTLCEQDAGDLAITLQAVEEQFAPYLASMKWVNFGGGHHISRKDYDIALLEECIKHMQKTYNLDVYLEPGEAVALNAGTLRTRVLDVMENGCQIAILDVSAACHMPDVLEMPYRPPLKGAAEPGVYAYTYRLAGPSCLAGDVIGDYSFPEPLHAGQELVFEDMAIYTMVKTNHFNGMPMPHIFYRHTDGRVEQKSFAYEDFKQRLG